jgi:hypothetical protein
VNRALRRIFGPKWIEAIRAFYSSPNIITMVKSKRMRCTGHIARMKAKRNGDRIFVRKPEGKRTPERPRCNCMDDINKVPREVGCDGINWIHLPRIETMGRLLCSR